MDELETRAADLSSAMNSLMWSDADGLYFNRKWNSGGFVAPKVAAPTNFYPLLVSAASDAQVANCLMWTVYGVFAAKDVFVWGPNGTGLVLGLVQLALKLLFPSKDDA